MEIGPPSGLPLGLEDDHKYLGVRGVAFLICAVESGSSRAIRFLNKQWLRRGRVLRAQDHLKQCSILSRQIPVGPMIPSQEQQRQTFLRSQP